MQAFATGSNGSGEVIAERTVRDPLLDTVHDVVLAVGSLRRRALNRRHVASRERITDRQTDALLAHDALTANLLAHFWSRKHEHRRHADDEPGADTVAVPRHAQPSELLVRDHLVKRVELFRRQPARKRHPTVIDAILHPRPRLQPSREHPSLPELFVQLLRRRLPRDVLLHHIRPNVLIIERSHRLSKPHVRFIVIRARRSLKRARFRVRHLTQRPSRRRQRLRPRQRPYFILLRRLLQDLAPVQRVKRLRGVLSRRRDDERRPSRVKRREFR